VVGLDPIYLELVVTQEPEPTYDPATHTITATEVINATARTVTRGWQLVELPPLPPPEPDYVGFYQGLLISGAYASVLQQSMISDSPALATLIAVFVSAIGEAMAGRANPQALQQAVWLLLSNVVATQADVIELQTLLVVNHLDGIYTLQPPVEN
jgi:hypothetical protein